jgi:hypothetical protein
LGYFALLQHHSDKKIIDSDIAYYAILQQIFGFAHRIFVYLAILQQMSGFTDRIFGYFEILLQQLQVPGTGTVYCSTGTQILVLILVPRYRPSTRYLYLL